MTDYTCSVEGCQKKKKGRGLCSMHYRRLTIHGTLDAPWLPEETRFLQKVDKSDEGGCWIYTGCLNHKGYGDFWYGGRVGRAHRFAYETWVGPIPDGMVIDHFKCFNRACVNPEHLRAVSSKHNNHNREGANRESKTGVLGVYWVKALGKYQVSANTGGKRYYGGTSADLKEAGRASYALREKVLPGWVDREVE